MLVKHILWDFEDWHNEHPNADRLQRHETMKALLFKHGGKDSILEYKIPDYGYGRAGVIDYIDSAEAIEIDDGPNEKSLQKLAYARDCLGKTPFWILILRTGKGGKARRLADKYNVTILRILARNNHFSFEVF